jgi:hypothetical protein
VGTKECLLTTVVSNTTITCRTQSGTAGTVMVKVRLPSLARALRGSDAGVSGAQYTQTSPVSLVAMLSNGFTYTADGSWWSAASVAQPMLGACSGSDDGWCGMS